MRGGGHREIPISLELKLYVAHRTKPGKSPQLAIHFSKKVGPPLLKLLLRLCTKYLPNAPSTIQIMQHHAVPKPLTQRLCIQQGRDLWLQHQPHSQDVQEAPKSFHKVPEYLTVMEDIARKRCLSLASGL